MISARATTSSLKCECVELKCEVLLLGPRHREIVSEHCQSNNQSVLSPSNNKNAENEVARVGLMIYMWPLTSGYCWSILRALWSGNFSPYKNDKRRERGGGIFLSFQEVFIISAVQLTIGLWMEMGKGDFADELFSPNVWTQTREVLLTDQSEFGETINGSLLLRERKRGSSNASTLRRRKFASTESVWRAQHEKYLAVIYWKVM